MTTASVASATPSRPNGSACSTDGSVADASYGIARTLHPLLTMEKKNQPPRRKEETARYEGDTEPAARRSGKDGVDPQSVPGEFADDVRVNRSTPPPAPKR